MRTVIFSDLDGTLLSKDYSFEAATPALQRIKKERIPLVLTTSKTRAEVEHIRGLMGNSDPFITENGGAVYIPRGYFGDKEAGEESGDCTVIRSGVPYEAIRLALMDGRRKTGARAVGFGDLAAGEISRLTGLTLREAYLSKQRECDEPFFMEDGDGAGRALFEYLEAKGLKVTKGRLGHITGTHDKGTGVRVLKGLYAGLYGEIKVIAAGDAQNDLPMLMEADYPVLVRNAGGGYEPSELPGLIRAEGAGPEGWTKAVTGILDTMEAARRGYSC